MQRKTLIMLAVSLGFFFVTATTFTSLGLVLYTMVAELHWSQAAAGFSFSLLGLACGLSSPLPALMMKWVGSRWTLFAGGLVLGAGFLLASLAHGIGTFFVATCLMGAGFTLIAPAPAVYLLATWFPLHPSRKIGYYFMAGSFGGVVGPPLVGAIVTWSGDWRVHWQIMAVAAVALGLFCLLCVRDVARIQHVDEVRNVGAKQAPAVPAGGADWTVRGAMLTRQFILIAAAMLVVQTSVTTIHFMLVAHVASLGVGSGHAALAMSLVGLTGTIAKGVSGPLAERWDPKTLLIGGMALQLGAFLLLAFTATPAMAYLFSLLFGIGWGGSWLAAHVLLLRYFGSAVSGSVVAMATMMTTPAVLGPLSAGAVADRTGGYTPMFLVFAALLAVVVVSTTLLSPPRAPGQGSVRKPEAPDPALAGARH